MTQLRANINQTENEKKRKRDSKKSQVNTTLPIIESNNQQIEDTIDTTNYITTEEDWDERLKE
jgi:hypothetical protein